MGIQAAKAVNALELPENGAAVVEEELMHSLVTVAHSLVHFLFGGYLTWLAGRVELVKNPLVASLMMPLTQLMAELMLVLAKKEVNAARTTRVRLEMLSMPIVSVCTSRVGGLAVTESLLEGLAA